MRQQALEVGQRNAEAIELVRKHCANARVEHDPMGGIGMLEQMTGLPIGMRTVKCDYAPKPPNFAQMEFLPVALSFTRTTASAVRTGSSSAFRTSRRSHTRSSSKSKPKSRGANARSGARKTSARRDTGRVSGA